MSGSFAAGWAPNDPWISSEVNKIVGCFYDHTTSGTVASVTVTLPTGGADIEFKVTAQADTAGANLLAQFNADTGTTYDYQFISASLTTTTTSEGNGQTSILVGALGATTNNAAAVGSYDISIPNYRGTVFWKTLDAQGGAFYATGSGGRMYRTSAGVWRNPAAVTTVSFLCDTGNLAASTRIRGYVSG